MRKEIYMPIFVFNKLTKLFSIMILSPIDERTLIVKDTLCMEYKLVFDNHEHLHDTMMKLYKQRVSYVYCDCYLLEQTQNYTDTREREMDIQLDDLELEL